MDPMIEESTPLEVSVTTDSKRALGSRLGLPCRVSAQVGAQYGCPPIDAVCMTELCCGVANAPRPHSFLQATASFFSLYSSHNESSQRPCRIF